MTLIRIVLFVPRVVIVATCAVIVAGCALPLFWLRSDRDA